MSAHLRDSDLVQLRVPPQSVEAEQAVIGGLMLAPESLGRVASKLSDSDFYRRDHRLIYRAICELDSFGPAVRCRDSRGVVRSPRAWLARSILLT